MNRPPPNERYLNHRWLFHFHRPRLIRLLSHLLVGLTTGVVAVLFDLSFATFIFSGGLSQHLLIGIELLLFSAAATRVMVAFLSSCPGVVTDVGTVPTAMLAWSAGSIAEQMPLTATSTELLITVLVAIGLTSVLTGAVLLLIGISGVGQIVHLVPYPVVGGFVASTGWLLVKGAFRVMVGKPPDMTYLSFLFETNQLICWLPGFILAIYLLYLSHRRSHPLIMSMSLFAAVGLFYLLLFFTGASVAQIGTQGLTLARTLASQQVRLLGLPDLMWVNWQVIAEQFPCMMTIVMMAAISLLLNISGLEMVVNREIDVNRELKIAGVANLITGLAGGILSYHSLSKSVLAQKMGRTNRLTTLITAGVFVGVPWLGASLLAYFPRAVLGGLLLFLGLSLLIKWIYAAWFRLPKSDYLIVQLILVISGAVGFLQGLLLGWALVVMLFFIASSRHR